MMHHALVGLFSIAVASACNVSPVGGYCEGDPATAPPEDRPPDPQSRIVAQVAPLEYKAIDVLFVIDDSRSMMDEQEQLGIWSSELFDVLSESNGLPDLHLGVISSSVSIPGIEGCERGGDGFFHVGSANLGGERFLRDVEGAFGRERNYEGALTEAFAKMARVGDSGCGFEQPFEATRLALSGSETFLRDDALLLVVFVTDEDDCSASDPLLFGGVYADACSALGPMTSYRCFEHGVRCYDGKGSRAFGERENCRPDEDSPYMSSVSSFAHFLKSLKSHPGQVALAGIYGKPHQVRTIVHEKIRAYRAPRLANVCGTGGDAGTGATPAVRLHGLLSEFPARASQSSICESELSWAMREAGLVARDAASRSRCLRGSLVDTDEVVQGVQPACQVEAVANLGSPGEERVKLPLCDGSRGKRCYTLEQDMRRCTTTDTQLAIHVAESFANETLIASCKVSVAN